MRQVIEDPFSDHSFDQGKGSGVEFWGAAHHLSADYLAYGVWAAGSFPCTDFDDFVRQVLITVAANTDGGRAWGEGLSDFVGPLSTVELCRARTEPLRVPLHVGGVFDEMMSWVHEGFEPRVAALEGFLSSKMYTHTVLNSWRAFFNLGWVRWHGKELEQGQGVFEQAWAAAEADYRERVEARVREIVAALPFGRSFDAPERTMIAPAFDVEDYLGGQIAALAIRTTLAPGDTLADIGKDQVDEAGDT